MGGRTPEPYLLTARTLAWLRVNIPTFAELRDRMIASGQIKEAPHGETSAQRQDESPASAQGQEAPQAGQAQQGPGEEAKP